MSASEADVEGLRNSADDIAVQMASVAKQLDASKRLTLWHAAISILVCVLLVAIGVMFVKQRETTNQTRATAEQLSDCIVPTGKCAQRNAAAGQLYALSVGKRTEVERLLTEIQVGEQTGVSPGAIRIRKERLVYVQDVLRKIGENLQDVQQGRSPRNQIPTELASDLPT